MKATLIMTDGITQIMLTPETDFERGVFKGITDDPGTFTPVFREVIETRGGFLRYVDRTVDQCPSLLLVRGRKKAAEALAEVLMSGAEAQFPPGSTGA